jgi:hypothetical protein
MALGDSVRRDLDYRIDNLAYFLTGTAHGATNIMKANHPWQDRTGDARSSLLVSIERKTYPHYDEIVMTWGYHGTPGVDYGVFLEKANGGVYGIVDQTVDYYRPFITKTAHDHLTSPAAVPVLRLGDLAPLPD